MDWIAAALDLLGKWQVGNKKKIGWIIHILAVFAWAAVALLQTPILWGLLSSCGIYCLINVRNLIKWVKEDKEKVSDQTSESEKEHDNG